MGLLRIIWQYAEFTSVATSAVGSIVIAASYALASALRLAPQRRLLAGTAAAVGVHMAVLHYFKIAAHTPTRARADAAMEAWLRRLDRYVMDGLLSGEGDESSSGKKAALLLTPLAVITGSSSGLGQQTTENLLTCGWKVVMACRNAVAAEEARAAVIAAAQSRLRARYGAMIAAGAKNKAEEEKARIHRLECLLAAVSQNASVAVLDVTSAASIRAFVKETLADLEASAGVPVPVSVPASSSDATADAHVLPTAHDGLRLLMNNAGLFQGCYGKWAGALRGVEGMFAANYAGPAYLTHLVMRDIVNPRRGATKRRRVPFRTVNLASCYHLFAFGSFAPSPSASASASASTTTLSSPHEASEKRNAALKSFAATVLAAIADPTKNPSNCAELATIGADTYGISKLGNIALAYNCAAAARKEEEEANNNNNSNSNTGKKDAPYITAFSLHPGGVRTLVTRHVLYPRTLSGCISELVFRWIYASSFRHVRYGACNQTYLALALIEELRDADPLTKSVVDAAATAGAYNARSAAALAEETEPTRSHTTGTGTYPPRSPISTVPSATLGGLVVPASLSGAFLVDGGQGVEGDTMGAAAVPAVYEAFAEWTAGFVAACESEAENKEA